MMNSKIAKPCVGGQLPQHDDHPGAETQADPISTKLRHLVKSVDASSAKSMKFASGGNHDSIVLRRRWPFTGLS